MRNVIKGGSAEVQGWRDPSEPNPVTLPHTPSPSPVRPPVPQLAPSPLPQLPSPHAPTLRIGYSGRR
jgi:hypothetical protein